MESIIISHKCGKQEFINDLTNVFISGNYLIVTTKKQHKEKDSLQLIKSSQIFNLSDLTQYDIIIPTKEIPNEYNN